MDDQLKYFEDIKRHVLDGQSGLKIIKKPIEKIMVRNGSTCSNCHSPGPSWTCRRKRSSRPAVASPELFAPYWRIIWEIESYGLSSLNELMMKKSFTSVLTKAIKC